MLRARQQDVIALSHPVFNEIKEVLRRPKFARYLTDADRREVLGLLAGAAVWVEPTVAVTDCRDPKDNIYLELAAAAQAEVVVSSDGDLLALNPWRGALIMRPADYLALPDQ
jgi:uncharacterized protein